MDLIEHFQRQFAYNVWANREVLVALRATSSAVRPVQLLAHILSAERLWLERIRKQPQSLPVWLSLSANQCQAQITELANLWQDFFRAVPVLTESISYRNSKGETWNSTVQDILTHVLLHSAYHRGQIASAMRASGEQPAYTDFIHAVRQELIA